MVLAVALAFEGASWWIGMRAFGAAKRGLELVGGVPPLEGSAGIHRGFRGFRRAVGDLSRRQAARLRRSLTGDTRWDGVASLVIAAILAGVAALLAEESKELLIGERADPALSDAIMRIAARHARRLQRQQHRHRATGAAQSSLPP